MQATRLWTGVSVVSLLCLGLGATPNGVIFNKGDGRIDVVIAGKPFTTYYYAANLPRPFFHPLRTADGKVVTRGFPMVTDDPAESKDGITHTIALAGSLLVTSMASITGAKEPRSRAGL